MGQVAASHEFLEHTGEVECRLRAPDLPGVLAQAGRALAELQLGSAKLPPPSSWRDVSLAAPDSAALLVDWINELIFLAETGSWVPVAFDMQTVTETSAEARVGGVDVPQAPTLVKAATLHRARVSPVTEGLEANVVLDI